jgi:hypothetical protein
VDEFPVMSSRFGANQGHAMFVEWSPRPNVVMRVTVGCQSVRLPVVEGRSFGYDEVALKKIGQVSSSPTGNILTTRMYGWHPPSRTVIVSDPYRKKSTRHLNVAVR